VIVRSLLMLPLAAVLAAAPATQARRKYPRRTPVVEAVERTRAAVVNLNTTRVVREWADWPHRGIVNERRVPSLGTGCIISRLGYIVTNWHVVENVDSIRVTLRDKTTYPAHVVVRDPDLDLAILKIEPAKPLPEIPLGTSSDLMIGETVIAVGNPFGYQHTVTTGVISALERSVQRTNGLVYNNLIQTDASINPGNSGGPLLNINGEMIGMNTAIRTGAENIGFAIPVDTVKQGLARLLSIRRLRHTWHGATTRELTAKELPSGPGAAVVKTEAGSPAAKAGLKPGDIVTAIDGKRVTNTIDFEMLLLPKSAGDTCRVAVVRAGEKVQANLTLRKAPVPKVVEAAWQRMGMEVELLPAARAKQLPDGWRNGMRVTRVLRRGLAAAAGLEPGDILVAMAGYRVESLSHLDYILKQHDRRVRVRLFLVRGGRTFSSLLVVGEPNGNG